MLELDARVKILLVAVISTLSVLMTDVIMLAVLFVVTILSCLSLGVKI